MKPYITANNKTFSVNGNAPTTEEEIIRDNAQCGLNPEYLIELIAFMQSAKLGDTFDNCIERIS